MGRGGMVWSGGCVGKGGGQLGGTGLPGLGGSTRGGPAVGVGAIGFTWSDWEQHTPNA